MTQKEKLIELMLICDKESDVLNCFHERPRLRQAAEIIADYLLANGVVVPLCRAGDWIYVLPSDLAKTHPVRMQVQCVSISTDSRRAILRLGGDTVDALWNDDCGKTWFLSEDEAEAAIKKRRIQNE